MSRAIGLLGILLFITNSAYGSFLVDFKNNSREAMNQAVEKFGAQPDPQLLEDKIEACRQHRTRDIITNQHLHSIHRSRLLKLESLNVEPIEGGEDRPEKFLEVDHIVTNLVEMDAHWRSAKVEVTPWSGDYWAIRHGGLAKRYLDPEFPTDADWLTGFAYFQKFSPATVDAALLSPAEKYDSLTNDPQFNLANANWQNGKRYNDEHKDVEGWMGFCHGWAPAAFMEARPTQTIQVASLSDSTKVISFNPEELKALYTLKWANGVNVTGDFSRRATRFMGGRCNDKEPKTDPGTGRLIDKDCFDLNPGAWHITVVNHLAQEQRSLVIDATFDYEVWNQPVVSYSYGYFSPKTLQMVTTLEKARVSLDDPDFKDKFSAFRKNPKAKSIVGVVMNVSYVVETHPSAQDTNGPEHDAIRTARYHYDLELDENDKIIGGEWYQNQHPDFIWMPEKNSVSYNYEDTFVKNESDAIRFAPVASKKMIPLHFIIQKFRDAIRGS